MSFTQAVARRLLLKMLVVAEAVRRSATYCEVNHFSSHCTAISPRADNRQTQQAAPLDSCMLFVSSSSAVVNGSIRASSSDAHGGESRWNAPFFVSWCALRGGCDICPSPCSKGSDEYLQQRGCCAAVEEHALIDWWKSLRHPEHKSFLLRWPDGFVETFHAPDFGCKSTAGTGGRYLSKCVMNDLCLDTGRRSKRAP